MDSASSVTSSGPPAAIRGRRRRGAPGRRRPAGAGCSWRPRRGGSTSGSRVRSLGCAVRAAGLRAGPGFAGRRLPAGRCRAGAAAGAGAGAVRSSAAAAAAARDGAAWAGREVGTGGQRRRSSSASRRAWASRALRTGRGRPGACVVQALQRPPAVSSSYVACSAAGAAERSTSYRRAGGCSWRASTRVSPLRGRVIGSGAARPGDGIRAPTRRRAGARGGCAARRRPRWRRRTRPW